MEDAKNDAVAKAKDKAASKAADKAADKADKVKVGSKIKVGSKDEGKEDSTDKDKVGSKVKVGSKDKEGGRRGSAPEMVDSARTKYDTGLGVSKESGAGRRASTSSVGGGRRGSLFGRRKSIEEVKPPEEHWLKLIKFVKDTPGVAAKMVSPSPLPLSYPNLNSTLTLLYTLPNLP